MPLNEYQQQLITMGSEIIRLWFWEPPAEMIAKSNKIHAGNKRHNKKQRIDKRPGAILNNSTTFALMKPSTAIAHSSSALFQDVPSDQTLLTPVSLDGHATRDARQLFTSADEDIMLRSFKLSVTGTLESDSETDDNLRKSGIPSPQVDIMSWYEHVVDCKPDAFLPFLTPTPFEKGTIGGPSVNDVLMIEGLIHPALYMQFLDLRPFSLL
jgi:hypothetical protein